MLRSESGFNLAAEMDAEIEKRAKADADHDRKKKSKIRKLSHPGAIDWQGLPIHMSAQISPLEREKCEAVINQRNCILVPSGDIHNAVSFIVPDPGKPDPEVKVVAALLGGAIACPKYLASCGQLGIRIWFQAMVSVKRCLFISEPFVTLHPSIAGCLAACVDCDSSKWRWCSSLDEFRRIKIRDAAKAARLQRPMDTLGLVEEEEKIIHGFEAMKGVFTLDQFLEFVYKPVAEDSTFGVAGL